MAKKKTKSPSHTIDSTRERVYSPFVNGEEIQRRRKRMGLSQAEAAKAAGWGTQQQWASIETGSRPDPRISSMEIVARVLRCKVDDLLRK